MRSDQEREGVLPESGEFAEADAPEAFAEGAEEAQAPAEAADPNAEETAEPNAAEVNAAEPEAGEERVKARPSVGSIIGTVLLAVLCVILIPLLAVNITLIVKGALYPDELTDVFNIAPVAIDNPYMEGEGEGCFNEGALVFIKTFDTDEERQAVEQGDVVAFRWEGAFVTYRIRSVERDEETGLITSVTTMGDNVSSDVSEPVPVPIEDVVGIHKNGIEGLGAFAMFLQTPIGVLVFVGIPVVAYVIYDILRVTLHNRRVRAEEKEELAAKEEELARLKALVEGPVAAEAAVEEPAPEVLLEEPPEEFPPEDGGAL